MANPSQRETGLDRKDTGQMSNWWILLSFESSCLQLERVMLYYHRKVCLYGSRRLSLVTLYKQRLHLLILCLMILQDFSRASIARKPPIIKVHSCCKHCSYGTNNSNLTLNLGTTDPTTSRRLPPHLVKFRINTLE